MTTQELCAGERRKGQHPERNSLDPRLIVGRWALVSTGIDGLRAVKHLGWWDT